MYPNENDDKPRTAGADAKDSEGVLEDATTPRHEPSRPRLVKHGRSLTTVRLLSGLGVVVLAGTSLVAVAAPGAHEGRPGHGQAQWHKHWHKHGAKHWPRPGHTGKGRPGVVAAAAGSECLIGGSAVAGGCVVTSQQPVLQIPGTGSGNVYLVDGSVPDANSAWVSPSITLSPNSTCGGNTCYPVPAAAGLLPRHSYQWTFVPSGGGGNDLSWQGFTIDYVRAGREPTDSFGPLTIGLASGTVQTGLQTQAVQTASGTVQIGLSYRGGYTGTPTGEPWFPEDPAGALPVGWVFTGVDANVPWVRISAVDGVGGSGTRAVTLQAFDGSLLEYTNTDGGSGGWAPPVGVGRPANDYGTLAQSADGATFTWTSGTSVVTFVQSASDATLWLASQAQQVLPGAGDAPSPGLQVSWDAQGRLASIADQSSLDANGEPTRVARFYYGGDSQCYQPDVAVPSGLAAAPTGLLCGFQNLDGSDAWVFYYPFSPATSFGAYQLGQVALPGGATWSFDWQTASYVLINNTTVTAPQLLSVQTPSDHDAAGAGTVAADDSKWWVAFDPFFGEQRFKDGGGSGHIGSVGPRTAEPRLRFVGWCREPVDTRPLEDGWLHFPRQQRSRGQTGHRVCCDRCFRESTHEKPVTRSEAASPGVGCARSHSICPRNGLRSLRWPTADR